jgi:hypothetical protein
LCVQPQIRETAGKARERQAPAVGEASNADDARAAWRSWAQNLGIAAVVGVFLSFVGALNTGELPMLTRLIYWVPLMMGGGLLGQATGMLIAKIPHAQVNQWVFGALLAVVMAVPTTLAVWAYSSLIVGTWMPARNLPMLFGSVLVMCCAMTALMLVVSRPGRVTHAPPAGAPVASVRFAERLPAKLKGAVIYAVSAEDHYLRLHTSKGSDLILMRLSDAIAELDGLEGAQTHRSWWVAREAVEGARRDGDKMMLTLKGGAEAPVSRPNVKPLRDAGWY